MCARRRKVCLLTHARGSSDCVFGDYDLGALALTVRAALDEGASVVVAYRPRVLRVETKFWRRFAGAYACANT